MLPDKAQMTMPTSREVVQPGTVRPQTKTRAFYHLYFQAAGVAEAELELSAPHFILRLRRLVAPDRQGLPERAWWIVGPPSSSFFSLGNKPLEKGGAVADRIGDRNR